MPLFGTLKTMLLPDLLQWLGNSRKSGTLQIESKRVRKWLSFRDGHIVGCYSDDPPERLGQFLLARGKITEDQLRVGLEKQESEKKHLGKVLTEMGALKMEEITPLLEAKAEETIYSLFEWTEAVFRFHQTISQHANIFPVDLRVEDVLLRGLQRFDEVERIRTVFNDPGIVLRHTQTSPPAGVLANRMARLLYEAVNGERTVAEILLHIHGSEFLVTKFLFQLHRNGFLEIIGTKPTRTPAAPVAAAVSSPVSTAETQTAADPDDLCIDLQALDTPAPAEMFDIPDIFSETAQNDELAETADPQLSQELSLVKAMLRDSKYVEALELLNMVYDAQPSNTSVGELLKKSEAEFIDKAYRHFLPATKIPVLNCDPQELESQNLSPSEFFLLSRIDGSWDVKSIIQVAPLREVDALLTLKRMREKGVIDLRDP